MARSKYSRAQPTMAVLSHRVCTPEGADEVRVDKLKDGERVSSSYVYRGDMCLERFECRDTDGDSQCDDCRTRWCDAPPPECADD